ncbi:MAG: hypothetical protein ACRC2T_00725 [Thermoguttaceae bacterium]
MKKITCLLAFSLSVFLVNCADAQQTESCCPISERPDSFYEMVPNVVLPKSIQYKPSPYTQFSGPYTVYQRNPATYTPFPSYILQYPADMCTVQQGLYPVTQQNSQPSSSQNDGVPGLLITLPDNNNNENESRQDFAAKKRSSDITLAQYSSPAESMQGGYISIQNPAYAANVQSVQPNQNLQYAQNVQGMQNMPNNNPPNVPNVQSQIQKLIEQNPNLQFSFWTLNQNGQVVPLNSQGQQNPYQQQNAQAYQQYQQYQVPQMSQEQQMRIMQWQAQYIQMMNQYATQVSYQNAQRAAGYGGMRCGCNPLAGCFHNNAQYTPGYQQYYPQQYAQPQPFAYQMPGGQQGVVMPNPYYASMYSGGMVPTNQNYMQMYPNGVGIMTNPYYPTNQYQQTGFENSSQQYKGFFERLREKRIAKEHQMCTAWRAPYYPEGTNFRMPSKDAYPWGYFGSQVAPAQTSNFGGYYNLYYGNSTYPGQ